MTVVVSREISASADAVWPLVSDLTRMGEWSPENQGGEWIKGATGPAVGALFKGRNSNGKRNWSTTVKVIEFDPPKRMAFALMVGKSAWCDWVWEVTPSANGCTVTHSWIDRRSKLANWLGGKVSGVTDRAAHNRANMERTIDALAETVRAR
ncbi:MAG: SRPBCC family protein [Actinomycetota bacterium]